MKVVALLLTGGLLLAGCTQGETEGEPPAATPTPAAPQTSWSRRCVTAIDSLEQPLPETEAVLDAVALPTRPVLQANTTDRPDWLFAKFGLLVRANREVTLEVDPAAVEWGRIGWSDVDEATLFTMPACAVTDSAWRAYAGGYYVRSGPRCLPLTVRAGDRTAQVRISVGVMC
ncbi:MAG TPA: hypothetical protein VFC19_07745 [Candidatus Limnocylindrales bacterium]|nr:hypothetical protein [Candidatus Limnocylindrales bacterium]